MQILGFKHLDGRFIENHVFIRTLSSSDTFTAVIDIDAWDRREFTRCAETFKKFNFVENARHNEEGIVKLQDTLEQCYYGKQATACLAKFVFRSVFDACEDSSVRVEFCTKSGLYLHEKYPGRP